MCAIDGQQRVPSRKEDNLQWQPLGVRNTKEVIPQTHRHRTYAYLWCYDMGMDDNDNCADQVLQLNT